ncbi:MAG: hypothetical protein ABSF25_20025 [Bryobacteraceae bacterium]|jgi:hypothetical protein
MEPSVRENYPYGPRVTWLGRSAAGHGGCPAKRHPIGAPLLGLSFGIRAICGIVLLLIAIPYYAGINSSDVTSYDASARYYADDLRAGRFSEAPLGLGSDAVVLWFSLVYAVAGMHLWVLIAIHCGLSFWAAAILGRLAASLGESKRSGLVMYLLFAPNLAVWTVLPGKDSWVYFGMALCAGAIAVVTRGARSLKYMLQGLAGLLIVFVFRPHVGLLLFASLGLAFLLTASTIRRRRWARALITLGAFGGAALVWPAVQKEARLKAPGIEWIDDRLVQNSRENSGGGSGVEFRNIENLQDLAREAPAGILRLVAEPLPWDVKSVGGAAASFDCLLLIALLGARLSRIRSNAGLLFSNSSVMFAFLATIAVVCLLVTIGNVGLIVRQKIQLAPLFVLYGARWRNVSIRLPSSRGRDAGLVVREAL